MLAHANVRCVAFVAWNYDKLLARDEIAGRVKRNTLYNIQEVAPTGTSKAAGLRTLRSRRPDLHEKVIKDELSVNAAMSFYSAEKHLQGVCRVF